MPKTHLSLSDYIKSLTVKTKEMTIRVFHFNPLQVNTIVLHDETGEAIIIDPGNCQSYEDSQLQEYILNHKLTVNYIINTHPHVDHIAGNHWCFEEFKAPICCHQEGLPIYNKAFAYGTAFGIPTDNIPAPSIFLKEHDEIRFGKQSIKVLYTPGHCDGSISLYDTQNKFVICGDLIFDGSVGRSDLPTGNASLLIQMIKEKILALDDDTVIYPGHGPATTVGQEKQYNPYLQ